MEGSFQPVQAEAAKCIPFIPASLLEPAHLHGDTLEGKGCGGWGGEGWVRNSRAVVCVPHVSTSAL